MSRTSTCSFCSTTFVAGARGRIRAFCSDSCARRAASDRPRTGTCPRCGSDFAIASVGPVAAYCSAACRQSVRRAAAPDRYVPAAPTARVCVVCSAAFLGRGKTRRCSGCRGLAPARPCLHCSRPFVARARARFCSAACASRRHAAEKRASTTRDESTRKGKRRGRERSVPGLSEHARRRLLARWVAAGTPCAYCGDAPASTVDHVVPLLRGGTNHEGNLAPACRPCNSRKGARLLVEWRLAA